ncbi:SDR family oxidoreductase [Streptomyces avermitilis]|uniref:SDR family oxidoreductase n=1 Tax=Streptomyces avermitilis TaxID=33903 RepID=UPI0033B003C2
MVLNLSPELGARGITINAVAPGGTATDMADTHALGYKHPLLDASMDAWEKMHGAPGRLARPEEIAAVTAFLVSDDASDITGRTIEADGGFFWTAPGRCRARTASPHRAARLSAEGSMNIHSAA